MLTQQEIFDKVTGHLREQRAKAMGIGMNADQCQYWDKKSGRKCAIGCLIPENRYSRWLEGFGLDSLFCNHPSVLEGIVSVDRDRHLLEGLQSVHDRSELDEWETLFKELAIEFKLKYTPLKGDT